MTAFEQEDLQFIGFPDDDRLWWVRWTDEYCFPYPGTDSAGIHVTLEPLPFDQFEKITLEHLPSIVKKAHDKIIAADRHPARPGLLVGGIPAIRIGDVYRRGKYIGPLPFPEKTFRIDTTKTIPVIRDVGEEIKPKPGEWNNNSIPCRTINPYDYHLQGLNPSRCLVIEDARKTLLIPCQEIFRIFFAPDGALANALTQQHWEQALESFVDMKETKSIPPNIWQVALRKRLPATAMRILCALILDEHAHKAAKRITSRFRSSENCWIETSFPFSPGLFELTARYVQLQTFNGKPRVLITCITQASWPYAGIIHRLENEKEPEEQKGVKTGSLPRQVTHRLPGQEIDPQREKIENVTPNVYLKPVSAFARGFSWETPPAIKTVRVQSPSGQIPVDVRFAGSPPVDQPTSSTGVPKGGRTSSGAVEISVFKERTFIPRFHALRDVFDGMLSNDALDDWHLEPAAKPVSIQGIAVWAVPNKNNGKSNAWCSIPGSKAPRVAIVFRLIKGSVSVYFLEIETRHSESGFRYVLFVPRQGAEDLCISELLQVAANHEGVWPVPLVGDKDLPSLESALTHKHAFVKIKTEGKKKEPCERALNGGVMAKVFKKFLCR